MSRHKIKIIYFYNEFFQHYYFQKTTEILEKAFTQLFLLGCSVKLFWIFFSILLSKVLCSKDM